MCRKFVKATLIILGLTFISADLFSQSLKFIAVGESSVKRGKAYEINWTGGVPDEAIAIQLVNKNGKVTELNTVANTGQNSMSVPGNLKIGTYTLKLVSLKSGEIAPSKEFKVKRKIPLAVQLSPLLVIPLVFLVTSHEDSKVGPPDPPSPD